MPKFPAPGAGVLLEIRVQEGETVEVGTVVAVIGEEGEAPAVPSPEAPESRVSRLKKQNS